MSEILNLDIDNTTVHELRRVASRNGFKGLGSAKRDDIVRTLCDAQDKLRSAAVDTTPEPAQPDLEACEVEGPQAEAEEPDLETALAASVAEERRKKGLCSICGERRIATAKEAAQRGQDRNSMPYCGECFDDASAKNEHDDNHHDEKALNCRFCGTAVYGEPEARPDEPKADRRGRKGMIIRAKGEVGDKIGLFRSVAEGAGYQVKSISAPGIYFVQASQNGVKMTLAWDADGRFRYEHAELARPGSPQPVKVRNLAAALRILEETSV